MSLSVNDIENIDFWKSIVPALSITDTPFKNAAGSELVCSDELAARMRYQMIEDGYFQTPVVFDPEEISTLREAVFRLHHNQIMPIFLSMYDEFWHSLYKLRSYFSSLLLDDYKLLPDFWIWNIAADDKSTGWQPHRDGDMFFDSIRQDGTPTICTVWIPLTDVEAVNSCMYVLPRKYDMVFQDFVRRKFGQPGIANANETPMPISKIRALPVPAGALLGWDTNILHWGSASSKWAQGPRISIGIYYQSTDSRKDDYPEYDELHRQIVECEQATILTYENRLTILANILTTYMTNFDKYGEQELHLSQSIKDFSTKWARNK